MERNNMIYVIADIHGEYKKFMNILFQIDFSDKDKMYILGDVIDRGKDSIKCLQYIMKQPNMEMLLGNHEDMMWKSIVDQDKDYYYCWMNNGGHSTLIQFNMLPNNEKTDILKYLQLCSYYKILGTYIFVHAGIDVSKFDFSLSINENLQHQDEQYLLWERDNFIYDKNKFLKDYTIIFGHTPTKFMQYDSPMSIWHSKNRIGIDCGACFAGGRLACLRLGDMKEFYS
jgi:serine/threonine protein phosphatase 1